jgi:HD-GYP domain-containing protein (c-di-GMP phosphodiesterase class II)
VALATLAVTGLPLAAVTAVQAAGFLRSTLASVAAAAALSLLASVAGSALWKRRRRSRDIVFADLMVWGWIRRLRAERRLSDAGELLDGLDELPAARRVEVLEQLSASLEARDPYTHGHSRRVTRFAEAIARGMGLPRDEVARIRTAATVHDVGKIHTPREVLNKPGRLSDEEFAAVKRHPGEGAEMVAALGDEALTAMVRHHHERLDGRGYPDGLSGDTIPLGARIIAVADTFDAITSTRPYRPGAAHKKALDILAKEAGTQLDPGAVAAFRRYYTGGRSVAWWSILVAEPPRLLSSLLGWLQGAGAAPLAKGVVAAGATALVGGAIAAPSPQAAEPRAERAKPARTAQAERDAGGGAREVLAADAPAAEEPAASERRAAGRPKAAKPRKRGEKKARPRARRERGTAPAKGGGTDGRGGGARGGGSPEGSSGGGGSGGGSAGGSGGGSGGSSGGSGSGGTGGGSTGGGSTGSSDSTGGGSTGSGGGVTVTTGDVPIVSDVLPEVSVPDPTGALPTVEVQVPQVEVPEVTVPGVEVGPVKVPPIKLPGVKLG